MRVRRMTHKTALIGIMHVRIAVVTLGASQDSSDVQRFPPGSFSLAMTTHLFQQITSYKAKPSGRNFLTRMNPILY